mmetsp:Transcript_134032/g.218219  ORF Transcript_134032/g.218219 Transcript_134032/m.218219 type:complete len:522 (+) Transcript_134032:89-1654(+)
MHSVYTLFVLSVGSVATGSFDTTLVDTDKTVCNDAANRPHDCPEFSDEISMMQGSMRVRHISNLKAAVQNAEQDAIGVQGDEEYYWSKRGRGLLTNSYSPHTAPSFSAGPTWVWQNEWKEQVRHSPLIDADFNLYVATTTRLRKFDSNGNLLWTWQAAPTKRMYTDPALHNGNIYMQLFGLEDYSAPTIMSMSMKTGMVNWQQDLHGVKKSMDAESLLVANDTLFLGARTFSDGSDTVLAANASDGSLLWKYFAGEVMWNFSPSTPGDGTLLFSSTCGAVFRISFQGELIWKVGRSHPGVFCTVSGGALGPNGIYYAEYSEGEKGAFNASSINDTLAAYNVTDGSLVWKRNLPYRAAQYPAVGKLGRDGPLAVVAPLGDNPQQPGPKLVEAALLKANGGTLRNFVMAFDAGTGETLWISEDTPYPDLVAAGDRDEHNATDGPECWPDAQGIPLIAGDGTVYTSSSHHGDLRAIRDSNNDGVISPSEVSTFKTGQCFLNSPSIAPGMLVAAPCWGPMYVFKS